MEFVANLMGLSPGPSLWSSKSRCTTTVRPAIGPNNIDLRRSDSFVVLVRSKQSYMRVRQLYQFEYK